MIETTFQIILMPKKSWLVRGTKKWKQKTKQYMKFFRFELNFKTYLFHHVLHNVAWNFWKSFRQILKQHPIIVTIRQLSYLSRHYYYSYEHNLKNVYLKKINSEQINLEFKMTDTF